MTQSRPDPALHPGMYAWDERDARSIARHTVSYGSTLFDPLRSGRPVAGQPAGATTGTPAWHGTRPGHLARALIARLRSGGRLRA